MLFYTYTCAECGLAIKQDHQTENTLEIKACLCVAEIIEIIEVIEDGGVS